MYGKPRGFISLQNPQPFNIRSKGESHAITELKTDEIEKNDTITQVFTMLERAVGTVPDTLRFLAHSPGLFEVQTNQIGYYQTHPNLGPELLALIRYTSACWFNNTACIDFNGSMLKKQGMTEEELEDLRVDPKKAPLEEKDLRPAVFCV